MDHRWRAEPNALTFYHLPSGTAYCLNLEEMTAFSQWLSNGTVHPCVQRLLEAGLIPTDLKNHHLESLKTTFAQTAHQSAPYRSLVAPEIMNLELTNRCPLRCPQCYCPLDHGNELPLSDALAAIDEAAELAVPFLFLSGGETLLYPHLDRLLQAISQRGLHSSISISGWGFTPDRLKALKTVGVGSIYISLNGSTKAINCLSRDGFEMALQALELLRQDSEVPTYINWVAREDNAADFPQMMALATHYKVDGIVMLASKPDAQGQIASPLQEATSVELAHFVRTYRKTINLLPIIVEPCFSPMRAFLGHSFFMNQNRGIRRGCSAGRTGVSLDARGFWNPCRHLISPEKYSSLKSYWQNSQALCQLRHQEETRHPQCFSCLFYNHCLPCSIASAPSACPLKRE